MTAPGPEHLRGYRMRDYDDLIARLGASRESQGLTLGQLAAKAGHSREQVSNWLRGNHWPWGPNLIDLIQAAGYDLALIPRDTEPPARICALLNADELQPALLFAAPAAAEALAEVRRRVAALPVSRIVNLSEWNAVQVPDVLAAVDAAAAELGIDVHGHEHPAGTPPHDHGPRLAIHRGVRGEHTEGHR